MTAKRKVLLGLWIALALFVLAVIVLLYSESVGYRSPEPGDLITEIMQGIWAEHPWVVLIITHLVAAPIWFLMGHFFAASRETYDAIRLRSMSSDVLLDAASAALAREAASRQ